MTELDWAALLRTAATRGLFPPKVWQLSLAEWRALAGGGRDSAPDRAVLDALRHQFPDRR